MKAPIALFVWNRPWHTQKTLESLEKNDLAKESELFIFADGPKQKSSPGDLEKIKKTRQIIRAKKWCKKVYIFERSKNIGLANSIISGVTEMLKKFEKIIVLEDDLLLSKKFLIFMNEALQKYENSPEVMQISGYMHPLEVFSKEDCFFMPTINSWGWGTWKRVWDNFDPKNKDISPLKDNKKLRNKFDLGGSYPFFKSLKNQMEKNIDSWAIRFYYFVFMKNGLTLYPKYTYVKNIGFDGSGVHCKIGIRQNDISNNLKTEKFPDYPNISSDVSNQLSVYFKKQMSLKSRFLRFIKQYILKKKH